jgi:hypothetical protein
MGQWDIDKELSKFEPNTIPGTQITRICMDLDTAEKFGVTLPKGFQDLSIMVWCLAIGCMHAPKHEIYGLTIASAFQRLRKDVKSGKIGLNPNLFPKLFPKLAKKKRRAKPAFRRAAAG